MKTIQMEMTLSQANLIVNALDLYSRMHMGQFSSLYSFLRMNVVAGRDLIDRDRQTKMDAYDEAEVHLKKFAETLGFSYNGSWGILSKEIHNEAREAFDIQQVLRQVESWTRKGKELGKDERDWTEMMGVNFDDPMFCSGKEPVKVKVVENAHRMKMRTERDVTVQVGRDIFNGLDTDIGRDAVRMYLISDFMNQLEYKYGVSASVNIEDVFDDGYDYIEGRDETTITTQVKNL